MSLAILSFQAYIQMKVDLTKFMSIQDSIKAVKKILCRLKNLCLFCGGNCMRGGFEETEIVFFMFFCLTLPLGHSVCYL